MDLLAIPSYLVGPVLLVWGWIRWIRHRPMNWTMGPLFSFVGFCLATAAYAVGPIVIALARDFEHPSPLIDPLLQFGLILSLSSLVCALGGVWRKSPLRWLAPALALCAFCFWLFAGIGV
jgi:hypothetical protein